GLGQDPQQVGLAERLQLHADRKAALQLRYQIARLAHVERARRDEQYVIRAHRAVLGEDGGALHHRQQVSLHAFARDVRTVAALAPRDLVDFVDEDDPRGLGALHGQQRDLLVVDEPRLFLLQQQRARVLERQRAALALAAEQARQQVLQLHVHLLNALRGHDLEGRGALLAHLYVDAALLKRAAAQLRAQLLPRLLKTLAGLARGVLRLGRILQRVSAGGGQQHVEQPLLHVLFGARADLDELFLAHALDRRRHQVAHHRLDVAPDVADLGELRGFDLDEGTSRQPGQPSRDLGLADSRRPDHQDVLGRDLGGLLGREALAADAVAQRDRDRALGRRLPHHVAVQLAHDLPRTQGFGGWRRGDGRLVERRRKVDRHRLEGLHDDLDVGVDADLGGHLERLASHGFRVERGV